MVKESRTSLARGALAALAAAAAEGLLAFFEGEAFGAAGLDAGCAGIFFAAALTAGRAAGEGVWDAGLRLVVVVVVVVKVIS
jgi:hypothetical protein